MHLHTKLQHVFVCACVQIFLRALSIRRISTRGKTSDPQETVHCLTGKGVVLQFPPELLRNQQLKFISQVPVKVDWSNGVKFKETTTNGHHLTITILVFKHISYCKFRWSVIEGLLKQLH